MSVSKQLRDTTQFILCNLCAHYYYFHCVTLEWVLKGWYCLNCVPIIEVGELQDVAVNKAVITFVFEGLHIFDEPVEHWQVTYCACCLLV